jgi:hypothetical protein
MNYQQIISKMVDSDQYRESIHVKTISFADITNVAIISCKQHLSEYLFSGIPKRIGYKIFETIKQLECKLSEGLHESAAFAVLANIQRIVHELNGIDRNIQNSCFTALNIAYQQLSYYSINYNRQQNHHNYRYYYMQERYDSLMPEYRYPDIDMFRPTVGDLDRKRNLY